MTKIWTQQQGTGVKLFYQEEGKRIALLAIGEYNGIHEFLVKGSGVRQDNCCGAPVVTMGVELNEKGEEMLASMRRGLMY